MKIAYCSDLHLEFDKSHTKLTLKNTNKADILVLAGDILMANYLTSDPYYMDFIDNCYNEFPIILYIIGNHEHYICDFNNTYNILKSLESKYPTLHILNNKTITINDIQFIGGTMWTNFNNNDGIVKKLANSLMNDYKQITNNTGLLTPDDIIIEHNLFINYLKDTLSNGKGSVIITHHAPSILSISNNSEKIINYAYYQDLDNFIMCYDDYIKLWIHGHVHTRNNYMIGNTHVVSNPRGYIGYEIVAESFKLEYIDI